MASDQALTSLRPTCQTPGPPSSTVATSSTAVSGEAAWPRSSWPVTSCSTGPSPSRCCSPSSPRTRRSSSGSGGRRTAAANLNHPNIVGVFDWGEADGTYFIVMEYVDGRTPVGDPPGRGSAAPRPRRRRRRRRRRRPRLRPPQRRRAPRREARATCSSRQAGQVKVADFGIARAITANADENLTQVGTVMGTATYFSPEQARGDAVDPRSDIYSLGCVLYELVVGRPPFTGDSPGGHRLQARAGVAGAAAPAQPRAAHGHRGDHPQVPGQEPGRTATRRRRTCAPTCGASARATASWPSR